MGGNFKFQVQDSFLEYLFWRFEKHIALSEKNPPLPIHRINRAKNDKVLIVKVIFTLLISCQSCTRFRMPNLKFKF